MGLFTPVDGLRPRTHARRARLAALGPLLLISVQGAPGIIDAAAASSARRARCPARILATMPCSLLHKIFRAHAGLSTAPCHSSMARSNAASRHITSRHICGEPAGSSLDPTV